MLQEVQMPKADQRVCNLLELPPWRCERTTSEGDEKRDLKVDSMYKWPPPYHIACVM